MMVAELDRVGEPAPTATGIPEGIPTQLAIEGVPRVSRRKKTALRGVSAVGAQVAKPVPLFLRDKQTIAEILRERKSYLKNGVVFDWLVRLIGS
ncbi:hypothetical protein [Glaciimonas immobilis]|uniref:Uncharacterized protein n=1 Tax=Glaciimonas immobilis TaxID=728004 RepID=A0A840RVV5_9BURK|nr:hypothetical protein [Glaciimonas immobilis]KAF3997708.1 hypothetical protein HAV38_13710 [Glaciimonas immobilis]MBB5200569.1 hypothetical protein [Glaciimonas immobilis]